MSPIIYQPHNCDHPGGSRTIEPRSLWQCETCGAVWVATEPLFGRWRRFADPACDAALDAAQKLSLIHI